MSASVASALIMSFFLFQSFQVDTEVIGDEAVGVKCKKIEDTEVYCKDGSTITFKCATTTGTDNC